MGTEVIKDPLVAIDSELLSQLATQVDEIGQVVLHFIYNPISFGDLIRIWPTTYLYDQHSDHKSDLVHIENITYYPVWFKCDFFTPSYFTLIFSGLPKSCEIFDFIEHCTN